MTYLKYIQYVYILFAAFFLYDGITKMQNNESPWLSFLLVAMAVFMFFFRRKFNKKFEDRNKK